MAVCFLGVGKCCRDRPSLICFGTGAELLRNLLKLGMSSSLMDVGSFSLLIAFNMSTSKTKDDN